MTLMAELEKRIFVGGFWALAGEIFADRLATTLAITNIPNVRTKIDLRSIHAPCSVGVFSVVFGLEWKPVGRHRSP